VHKDSPKELKMNYSDFLENSWAGSGNKVCVKLRYNGQRNNFNSSWNSLEGVDKAI